MFNDCGQLIEHITPDNIAAINSVLGGSAGTDVTGGMLTKVHEMLMLVQAVPGLRARIMSGMEPGLLKQTLLDDAQPGTLITSAKK